MKITLVPHHWSPLHCHWKVTTKKKTQWGSCLNWDHIMHQSECTKSDFWPLGTTFLGRDLICSEFVYLLTAIGTIVAFSALYVSDYNNEAAANNPYLQHWREGNDSSIRFLIDSHRELSKVCPMTVAPPIASIQCTVTTIWDLQYMCTWQGNHTNTILAPPVTYFMILWPSIMNINKFEDISGSQQHLAKSASIIIWCDTCLKVPFVTKLQANKITKSIRGFEWTNLNLFLMRLRGKDSLVFWSFTEYSAPVILQLCSISHTLNYMDVVVIGLQLNWPGHNKINWLSIDFRREPLSIGIFRINLSGCTSTHVENIMKCTDPFAYKLTKYVSYCSI